MSVLRISLFGTMQVEHDDWQTQIKFPRVAQALLAYLLLTPSRHHPREVLMAHFWHNHSPKQARSCLSTALWRLRQALEPRDIPKGTYLITTSTGEVGFNWESEFWLDVTIFADTIDILIKKPIETLTLAEAQKLETAVNLCTGDLLEGFYDDWALREREHLRQLYLDGLEHLMLFYKSQKTFKQSLTCGQQILEHDPLRESIHRELMHIYLEAGQPTMAVRQYQACQQILAQELKISPMPETEQLYTQLTSQTQQPNHVHQVGNAPPNLEQAMQELRIALQECQQAQQKLQQAAIVVQTYVNQKQTE